MTDINARALEALELEAEKRRQDAARKAQSPLPKCIKTIESTEVMFTLDPDVLPYALVDFPRLIELLRAKYQLSFVRPAVNDVAVQQLGLDPLRMTDEAIFRLLLAAGTPQSYFRGGRYPTGPNSFVPINQIGFLEEAIIVNVSGRTEVAEAVAADAFDLLWQASGALKKWDSPEIQAQLLLKSYGTRTKVDLGCNPRQLLNQSLVNFLDSNVNDGRRYGASMIAFSGYDSFKPSPAAIATWTFDDLIIQIHTFNQVTGRQKTSKLHLSVTAKDERGRGILDITSELPFDTHAELVESFVNVLQNGDKR